MPMLEMFLKSTCSPDRLKLENSAVGEINSKTHKYYNQAINQFKAEKHKKYRVS